MRPPSGFAVAATSGASRWLVVEGSVHQTFTDIPLLEGPSKRYPEAQFCSVENRTCE